MNAKTFNIKLDVNNIEKKTSPIITVFSNESLVFKIKIINQIQPYDIRNCNMEAVFVGSDNNKKVIIKNDDINPDIKNKLIVDDAMNGCISLILNKLEIPVNNRVRFQIKIKDIENDLTRYSQIFEYNLVNGL